MLPHVVLRAAYLLYKGSLSLSLLSFSSVGARFRFSLLFIAASVSWYHWSTLIDFSVLGSSSSLSVQCLHCPRCLRSPSTFTDVLLPTTCGNIPSMVLLSSSSVRDSISLHGRACCIILTLDNQCVCCLHHQWNLRQLFLLRLLLLVV